MKDMDLSVQDIKSLMDAFRRNKLGSLKLQRGDFVLELEQRRVEQVTAEQIVSQASAAPTGTPASRGSESEAAAYEGTVVTSPIVGTFYASPAPDKDPYVAVGSKVKKGDVLFIIESMKLMNEVVSEYDGVVTQILVENAQGVEYGQPVLVIGG